MTAVHIQWCETWVFIVKRAAHELVMWHNWARRVAVGTETQDVVDAYPDELRRFSVLLFCAIQPLTESIRVNSLPSNVLFETG
jgi:hypothetical protein